MKTRWLLPAGLLVLLVTPVLVFAVMPGSWLVPTLESTASTLLGRPVSIGGLELKLLSTTPGATLVDLSIEDDSGNPLARVGQANVAIDAGELLGGDVVFARIDIDKATLQLRTDAQGKNNWQDLLPADETAESRPQDAPASLPAIAALDLNDIAIDYQNAMNIDYHRRLRAVMAFVIVATARAGCGSLSKELEQMPEQDAVVVAGLKAISQP